MDLLRNSINKSKKNNSLKSSVKLFNNNLNKSLKTPINLSNKSLLKTIDTMKSNINNFDIKNIYKNNTQTNLLIFLFITIIISYISKKYFIHLGLLFILLIITYLITKNLFYALLISVIISNLIMLLNIDFNNKDKIQKQTKETKETKETS